MTQKLFEVERGLLIEGTVSFLTGSGAPTGVGGTDQALAGIGSMYLDSSLGRLYMKKTAGSGSDKWERMADVTEVSVLSWREPVLVVDTASTTLPGSNVVDGETIPVNGRVLFASLSGGGGSNVYIWNGATWDEDSNQESAGDMVYVIGGTNAGKTYGYSAASTWVVIGQAASDEINYIRAFIGKGSSGNVLPTYSSTFYVANGDTLQTAVGKLDTALDVVADALSNEITTRGNADAALQSEIDAIEAGAGLNSNGTYSPVGGTNYISTATSLKNADVLLDAQLKTVSDDVALIQAAQASMSTLLAAARTESDALSVTAAVTLDEVATQQVAVCKWIVFVRGSSVGDAGNREAIEVLAMHDGTVTVDATDVDFTKYAKLKLGNITGLNISVDVAGAGALQRMRLRVSSTMASDFHAIREVIEF